MYKEWLYFITPDAHLICLDAKNGKVRWNVPIADVEKGYWSTMSPLVVRDHVIVGVSGDMDNLPGFLRSIDPETGRTQWQWDSTAPLGTPNAPSGGMTWMTGTYDPGLNLIFWGTGNPTPVLTGKTRPGDNLYTCSIVALNADTGRLAWAFQPSPHDTHDWDAVETPVLVDADFGGEPRKMLIHCSSLPLTLVGRSTSPNPPTALTVGPARTIQSGAKGSSKPLTIRPAKSDGATKWEARPARASSAPTRA